MELTNPILHRELRQGLLGGRLFVTLWVFVVALATVVWLAWPRAPKLAVNQVAVAQQLFSLFWGGLYFVVAVLAAAMSSIAITREKETGCFELLCTTGLSSAKLLWGKFLSVVGFLLLLVVSSVPITSACYLMGGVNWQQIALQYLHLVAAVVLYGGVGLACSSLCERNHRALSVAFALAIPFAAWSVASGTAKWWIEGLGLVLLLTRLDKWADRVRRPREDHLPPVEDGQTIQISVDTDSVMDRVFVPHREAKPFRDDKNPVYEREWIEESATEGRDWWHFLLRINIALAVLVAIVLVCTRFWLGTVAGDLESKLAHYTELTQLFLFTYVIIVAVLIGPAQSANAISKERERQTGDLLLTTLLRPSEIVLGKWRLSVKSCFHLLVLLLVPLIPVFVLLCFGNTGAWRHLLVTAACGLTIAVATLVTLNTLGIFCSLLCQTSAQALATAYTIAVGWFVGPVVLYHVLTRFSEIPAAAYAWTTYATPFVGFFQLTGSEFFAQGLTIEPPLAVVGTYLALTAVVNVALLALAVLGFNRFWRRE